MPSGKNQWRQIKLNLPQGLFETWQKYRHGVKTYYLRHCLMKGSKSKGVRWQDQMEKGQFDIVPHEPD